MSTEQQGMTPEDWKYMDEQLRTLFGSVALQCDGYEVSFRLQQFGQFKNAIFFWVNGAFRGEWLNKDCEERRRFCRASTKHLFSEKERKQLKRCGSENWDKAYTQYHWDWTSFRALKRHLIANNKSITLIREGA